MPTIVSVIKYEGENGLLVWKHPKKDFNTGSELIVHENQEAVFVANGEILDIYGAGKHILETENMPVVRGIQKFMSGGITPYHAEIYFINVVEKMAIRWGTDSKISYMDPVYNFPLDIGACGEMSLRVNNSAKFLKKLVGMEKVFSQEMLTKHFRSFLMSRVKSIIPQKLKENNISVFEVDMHLDDLSKCIFDVLQEDFYDYGIKLCSFFITTVVKPNEDRNFIKFKELYYRKHNDITEAEIKQKIDLIEQSTKAQTIVMEAQSLAKKRELEGYTYQQEKQFEVAKEIAKNDAVAQFSNIGIGMGMLGGVSGTLASTIADTVNKNIENNISGNAEVKRYCTACGKELLKGMQFCGYCGTKVAVESVDSLCRSCGYKLEEGVKFCPKCGTKRDGLGE